MADIAKLKDQEAARVQAIIDRDRADRERSAAQRRAEIEVAGGLFVNLGDTVIPPTEEWIKKGDVKTYVPRQMDGTVREIRTVRRDHGSVIMRMFWTGKLTEEQVQAGLWYQRVHDIAGMEGRCASSQWSLTGTVQRSPGEAGFGYVPSSSFIAEARDFYRGARDSITPFYVRFFEAVAVGNVPIRRAARFARCRAERAPARFRDCTEQVIAFCASIGVDFPSLDAGD